MIGYTSNPLAGQSDRPRQSLRPRQSARGAVARRHKPDFGVLILSALLTLIGLILIYSISDALAGPDGNSMSIVLHKLLATGLAVAAFVIAAKVPLATWDKYKKPLLWFAVALTLMAIVLPVNPEYPAHRWVRFGGLSLQTIELVKFVMLIWLSAFLAKQKAAGKMDDFNATLKPLAILLVVGGGVVAVLQSDLGSAGVLVAMMGVMAFVAGLSLKKVLLALALIAVLVMAAALTSPYRRARLDTFLNPTSNCQTASGYQACQALISVGSGGFAGLGLGRSVQAYGYLPEAANDSIFAIYAEKFGFIGSIILLAIYAGLFKRIASIAERAPDDRLRLIVVGVLTWLAIQTLVNIGAMLGLLPLKGITLPFISYGGTSMIFLAAAVGLVFQISKFCNFTSPLEGRKGMRFDGSFNRRRVRRPYYANLSGSRRTEEAE